MDGVYWFVQPAADPAQPASDPVELTADPLQLMSTLPSLTAVDPVQQTQPSTLSLMMTCSTDATPTKPRVSNCCLSYIGM